MKQTDKVSVVVPVYAVEDVILRTLKSIVDQTYKNIELVLVNDGTPDKSIEVAERFLKEYSIDWKVINQVNCGLPTARNKGIESSIGEWVICPDSDDILAPMAIEKMLDAAYINNSNCVFCSYKIVHDDNYNALPSRDGEIYQYDIQYVRKLFLNRNLILLVPGMLIRRNIYDSIKFDKDCPYDEDIHFLWRLFFFLSSITYVDSDYYNYYERSTSMVHNLKPESYLKTSFQYRAMVKDLTLKYPYDKIVPKIYPKYRLGGLHVLSRSTNYQTFKATAIQDGYRIGVSRLISFDNFKLAIYAVIFCISLRLFYQISKM